MKFVLAVVLNGLLCTPLLAADWQLPDPQFARCVDEQAASHHWQQAAQITELNCNSRGIESIDGVLQFSHLRSLSVYNNKIKQLKLQGLAELESLNLANNQLEQLQPDNISNLPALQTLLIFNNQLKQLQLHNFPRLISVKGNNNQLLDFSYSNLPLLEKIVLFNNKMPTIDFEHLPALKIMDVRQNPMPNSLYDAMNKKVGVTFMHDGNAADWK